MSDAALRVCGSYHHDPSLYDPKKESCCHDGRWWSYSFCRVRSTMWRFLAIMTGTLESSDMTACWDTLPRHRSEQDSTCMWLLRFTFSSFWRRDFFSILFPLTELEYLNLSILNLSWWKKASTELNLTYDEHLQTELNQMEDGNLSHFFCNARTMFWTSKSNPSPWQDKSGMKHNGSKEPKNHHVVQVKHQQEQTLWH